ncbi:hypothetical protein CEF21_05520 [Bacillus sp. FJAT-42376]|nr:hypothetical protein CEF21_05520 [Bacillus sp. FJAT-42376]
MDIGPFQHNEWFHDIRFGPPVRLFLEKNAFPSVFLYNRVSAFFKSERITAVPLKGVFKYAEL